MMDKKTEQLMETAVARRQPLRKITDALRLVNGLGDGLPGLVLEQYGSHFVIHLFDRRWVADKEGLAEFIKSHFDVRYMIIKERLDPNALNSEKINASVWIAQAHSRTVVQEHGLYFSVDLNDGINSGLFLDMRRNRQKVAGYTKGAKVLNCFAYTCAFGVHARAAGAAGVVNVDINRKSLERGRKNYELNQLSCAEDEFVRADAAAYLARAVKKGRRFGCVILDPPSFARHEGKVFSIRRNFAALIGSALDVLEPGGILLAATNCSGYSYRLLEDVVKAKGGERVKAAVRLGQDADFPGSGRMPESSLTALLVKLR